jgi:hypothetical protein
LNTGVIEKIAEESGKVVGSFDRWDVSEEYKMWDRHGSLGRYEDINNTIERLEALPKKNSNLEELLSDMKKDATELCSNYFGLDFLMRGGRSVGGLVEFEGRVYDASPMGLFETDTGEMICSEWVSSVDVWNNMLCYVPVSLNVLDRIKTGKVRISDDGSFKNALTGEILVDRLTPFDGSGGSQGHYKILGDIAHVHHGNWPCETITQRNLKTGKKEGAINIATSYGFVSCGEKMLDIRNLHSESWITRTGEEDFRQRSILGPETITSAVSCGDNSILATVYKDRENTDKDRGNTDIVRVSLGCKRELVETVEGQFRFM